MNILDDIRADWRSEDARERVSRTAGRAIGGQDRDCWSGSHFVVGCRDVVVGFKNWQLEISSVSRESRKWVATIGSPSTKRWWLKGGKCWGVWLPEMLGVKSLKVVAGLTTDHTDGTDGTIEIAKP